jgi:hypothetical protein
MIGAGVPGSTGGLGWTMGGTSDFSGVEGMVGRGVVVVGDGAVVDGASGSITVGIAPSGGRPAGSMGGSGRLGVE